MKNSDFFPEDNDPEMTRASEMFEFITILQLLYHLELAIRVVDTKCPSEKLQQNDLQTENRGGQITCASFFMGI